VKETYQKQESDNFESGFDTCFNRLGAYDGEPVYRPKQPTTSGFEFDFSDSRNDKPE
jgi:hypothetical protein